jgi:lipopolysaccharide transport system permease protein
MDVSVSKSADGLKQSELTRSAGTDKTVQTPHSSLPNLDKPLITIEPSKGWVSLNLRELWAHRELLYFLTWRDIKVRYKQTVLGVMWAILQPFFMMLIFTLFFGRLAGIKTGDVVYPLFAFAGLVPWTFYANSVTSGGNSLTASAGLITKVYFPRLLVPIAAVAAGFVDFILAFIVLVGLMFYYQVTPTVNLLMLPVLAAFMMLFALGVGTWMAALNVKYRDIRFALPFLIQLWLFVSSVIAPSSAVPEKWRWLLVLNPMSGFIEGFRAALFGTPFNWTTLGIACAITLAVLTYSAHAFRRMEKNFADII